MGRRNNILSRPLSVSQFTEDNTVIYTTTHLLNVLLISNELHHNAFVQNAVFSPVITAVKSLRRSRVPLYPRQQCLHSVGREGLFKFSVFICRTDKKEDNSALKYLYLSWYSCYCEENGQLTLCYMQKDNTRECMFIIGIFLIFVVWVVWPNPPPKQLIEEYASSPCNRE